MPFGMELSASGFTSATTRGTCGSTAPGRTACTTMAPAAATFSASAREVESAAEETRCRGLRSRPSRRPPPSRARHKAGAAGQRADAKYLTRFVSKPRCSRISLIALPTRPVAPTMPMLTLLMSFDFCVEGRRFEARTKKAPLLPVGPLGSADDDSSTRRTTQGGPPYFDFGALIGVRHVPHCTGERRSLPMRG